MIDIACLIVVGVVTWMVANEGIWGAVETFLCTLLAALIAMNLFEPLAVNSRHSCPICTPICRAGGTLYRALVCTQAWL